MCSLVIVAGIMSIFPRGRTRSPLLILISTLLEPVSCTHGSGYVGAELVAAQAVTHSPTSSTVGPIQFP
jgi:hypothetical protein